MRFYFFHIPLKYLHGLVQNPFLRLVGSVLEMPHLTEPVVSSQGQSVDALYYLLFLERIGTYPFYFENFTSPGVKRCFFFT